MVDCTLALEQTLQNADGSDNSENNKNMCQQ
jgi:hypothetical protein